MLHALTGDSHVVGLGRTRASDRGMVVGIVGPGKYIDTDRWFVVAPNLLGGCQGSTGPASLAPDGREWAARFPYLTIRDQVDAQAALAEQIGVQRWAAVIGGSMGGMHALEWAVSRPDALERVAVLAAPATSTADQLALNSVQLEAIQMDPNFADGDYYEAADGEGPHRGLALARRMALLNYRSPTELNDRFRRSWQSSISPLGSAGQIRGAELPRFPRQQIHQEIRREQLPGTRGGDEFARHRAGSRRRAPALSAVTAKTLVLGIDSDRLFPVQDQIAIANDLPGTIDGGERNGDPLAVRARRVPHRARPGRTRAGAAPRHLSVEAKHAPFERPRAASSGNENLGGITPRPRRIQRCGYARAELASAGRSTQAAPPPGGDSEHRGDPRRAGHPRCHRRRPAAGRGCARRSPFRPESRHPGGGERIELGRRCSPTRRSRRM